MAWKVKRCAACGQPRRTLVRAEFTDQDAEITAGYRWLCVACLLTGILRVPRMAYEGLPEPLRKAWEVWRKGG